MHLTSVQYAQLIKCIFVRYSGLHTLNKCIIIETVRKGNHLINQDKGRHQNGSIQKLSAKAGKGFERPESGAERKGL
nr:MAG TPA: hypothetical protein [Caudoviricetes sp.]